MEPWYMTGTKGPAVEYLDFGQWQVLYAKTIVESIGGVTGRIIDIGCACGSQLMGFKATGKFAGTYGCDISEAMIASGITRFGFKQTELRVADAIHVPFGSSMFDIVHSHHVLEHLEAGEARLAIREMVRLVSQFGRVVIVVPVIRPGFTKDDILKEDPTHRIGESVDWWTDLMDDCDLVQDVRSYDAFARSAIDVTPDGNFWRSYPRSHVFFARRRR